jgi:hypothetical protein
MLCNLSPPAISWSAQADLVINTGAVKASGFNRRKKGAQLP